MVERFVIIQPIPSDIYADKPLLWGILHQAWSLKLSDLNGKRMPGPLHITRQYFGNIDDNTGEFIASGPKNWTYAMYRVIGPAEKNI